MLASEYGWTKTHILRDIFPDEVIGLLKQIRVRTVDNLLMQSRIAANPHLKPEESRQFIDTLLTERRDLLGFDRLDDEIDHAGVAKLKEIMAGGRAVRVK